MTASVGSELKAATSAEKINYKGWSNSYLVSNGEIELVMTADVGPRIIRLGFVGGQNFMKEYPEQLGKSGEKDLQLRGGHRLWKAPEDAVATWAPDNVPVEIETAGSRLIARAPVEPLTGLQKEIAVEMAASGASLAVTHRITNRTLFTLEFAPWALTMMAQGGVAVTGFPARGRHPINLEATNPLVMWAYTDLSDRRWIINKRYLGLRQDPNNAEAQKIGHFNPHTWGAYFLNGELFVKQYRPDPSLTYTDFGCSFEMFTNADMLEIETVGPLTKVAPNQSVGYVEHWSLHKDIDISEFTDSELDRVLQPVLR